LCFKHYFRCNFALLTPNFVFFALVHQLFISLRITFVLFFSIVFNDITAQQTLIKTFDADTFWLNGVACNTHIRATALTHGQQPLPHNLDEPVKLNLLRWRYFDDISGQYELMETRPLFAQGTQLMDTVPGMRRLQLHVNATVKDSIAGQIDLFFALGGVNRAELSTLPLLFTFDQDPDAERRFVAIAQMMVTNLQGVRRRATFTASAGTATLIQFNPKDGKVELEVEFTGSMAGEQKDRVFLGGYFRL
jgi:hypothetical protein